MPWYEPQSASADPADANASAPRRLSRVKVAMAALGVLILLPFAVLALLAVVLLLIAIKLITGELALARRWALSLWQMVLRKLTDDGRRNVRVREGQETNGPW